MLHPMTTLRWFPVAACVLVAAARGQSLVVNVDVGDELGDHRTPRREPNIERDVLPLPYPDDLLDGGDRARGELRWMRPWAA